MAAPLADDMKAQVVKELEGTDFAPMSLVVLSGGTANFIYHARQACVKPLDDGTEELLVKHGEDFVATNPDLKLSTSRCLTEEECLKTLSSFSVANEADSKLQFNFIVRTPRCLHFNEATNTQIQEYLSTGVDLKTYALQTCPSRTPESLETQSRQLGAALGRWLRAFHHWTAQQSQLARTIKKNKEMQQMKHMINFQWLVSRIEQFPSILSDVKSVFEEVKAMAAKEMEDETYLQVIHGDFWTGNVLLPNMPILAGTDIQMFLIDSELAQLGLPNLDLGQMIAEMYELWLYKGITAGLWMVQGFTEGYGYVSENFAFRTAIQIGVHLVCFGTSVPGWGSPEQVEEVARTGKNIIVKAWERDWKWFNTEAGDLACLFNSIE